MSGAPLRPPLPPRTRLGLSRPSAFRSARFEACSGSARQRRVHGWSTQRSAGHDRPTPQVSRCSSMNAIICATDVRAPPAGMRQCLRQGLAGPAPHLALAFRLTAKAATQAVSVQIVSEDPLKSVGVAANSNECCCSSGVFASKSRSSSEIRSADDHSFKHYLGFSSRV